MIQDKEIVLRHARENGHTLHNMDKKQVFPDIGPEALDKRRELREIIAILQDANIRFRWASLLKLQIFFKGHSYFISDKESRIEVLQNLNLPKPPRRERQPTKRKLQLTAIPPKDPKKAH